MTLQGRAQIFAGKNFDEAFPEVKKVVALTVAKANLRTGPDKTSVVAEQVTRQYTLSVLSESGDWYQVKSPFGDKKLYISKTVCKTTDVGTIPGGAAYHYYSRYSGATDIVPVKGSRGLAIMHTDSEMGGEQMNLGRYVNGMLVFYYNIMAYGIDNWKNLSETDVERIFREAINNGMNTFEVVTAKDIEEARKEFGDL